MTPTRIKKASEHFFNASQGQKVDVNGHTRTLNLNEIKLEVSRGLQLMTEEFPELVRVEEEV